MTQNTVVIANIVGRSEEFVAAFAEEFERRVRERTPVKTGVLRDGFETTITKTDIRLKNEVPYFEFVEYGTPRMAPRRMVTRTLYESDQVAAVALLKVQGSK